MSESHILRDADRAAAQARRVLVADDNRDAAETLAMLLRLSGHEVHVAHSGARALALALQVRPHVGVLDIGMPDIDGYDVARKLRREDWGGGILLIAVTGWGQEDKRKAEAAGFDRHLTKPIDPVELERLFDGADEA
jgi:CheY-like chemotaxis protein